MSKRKREARDKRRAFAGLAQKTIRKHMAQKTNTVEIEVMDAGEVSFKKAVGIPLLTLKTGVSQFFKYAPFAAFCLLFFYLVEVLLLFGATNVVFQDGYDANDTLKKMFAMAAMQIIQWLIAPMALFPWFAARTLLNAKHRVTSSFVMEPFVEKRQWLHLLALGVVGVLIIGGFGAFSPYLSQSLPWWAVWAVAILGWLVVKTTLVTATAGIWREGIPFWSALWQSIKGWRYFWKGFLGFSLGGLICFLAFALAIVVFFGIPLSMWFESPKDITPLAAAVFIPVFFLIMAFWSLLQATLGLTLWDWSVPVETEQETHNPQV